MDKIFERYLKKIGLSSDLYEEFDSACFKNYKTTNAKMNFLADVSLNSLVSYSAYKELFSCSDAFMKQKDGFKSELTFIYTYPPTKEDITDLVKEFIDDNNYYELDNFRLNPDTQTIVFEYNSVLSASKLTKKTEEIEIFLQRVSLPFKTNLGLVQTTDDDFGMTIQANYAEEAEKSAAIDVFEKKEKIKQHRLDMTYIPCKIKDAAGGSIKRVEVTGNIFRIDSRTTRKNNSLMLTIYYTDGTYSIMSNLFEGKKFEKPFLESLQVHDRILIKGDPEYNEFSKQMSINATSLEVLPELPKRMDTYPGEKRIELHLHTKMSAMDGVGAVPAYCEAASRWGWSAIGFTDHGGVQEFPEAQEMGDKYKLKILYGCELYMTDSKLKIAFNPSALKLKDATYTVFDLETSGLSARYDRIIEFGATKYCKGNNIDEIDFFINPDIKLSPTITKLTGITDEMVSGGKTIKKALQMIQDFIGDSILVAHNATFDYGFLNEAMKNNGMGRIPNPVIDTLPLSRYLFPAMRSHTLGAVASKVGASYDEDEAHRAIYDAQVLSSVWQAMVSTLLNTNPDMMHNELNGLTNEDVVLNAPHPYHVVAYCKNSAGLKELFQIISDSNIKYFNDVPRVPRELLEAHRENIILGSACYNGEVFNACMTKSEEVAKDVMKFYDYIEVQPPINYSFLVNDGQISSMDNVVKILKDMIKAAKDIGKTVVATSDCHYLDKEDQIYRDVFVFAKGLKGVRHPMNPYHRDHMKYYENPDQHLRTTDEMMAEFSFLDDPDLIKEIVIDNTHKIADMISPDIRPIHKSLSAPTIDNCDVLLKEKVSKKAHEWYGDILPDIVQQRLNAEMKGISENHYEVIYWIASKIVGQAIADGYIVGSRGSVGSSFVATMASITEVNPLPPHYRCPKCRHVEFVDSKICKSGFDLPEKKCPVCGADMIHDGQNIPFATFIGFHAEKTPDIDLNFPPDYQARAHELTKTLLTKESGNHVYKAGTIESVQDNMAIGYVKGYFESLELHPELNVKADEVSTAELMRIAQGCVNVKRTTGQHPGGIIVIPRGMDVTDFTPIQYPADKKDAEWETSHFDFTSMHDTILKLDLLGHVDPMALRMMSQISGKNIYEIPCNDPEVISLFTSPAALKMKANPLNMKVGTLGMPEFGTNFVMNLLSETHPKCFNDLLIVSGLSHGTNVYNGNQQDLIKNGTTDLRGVIGCRDDIMTGLHEQYNVPLEDSFNIMELVRHNRFTLPKFADKREKYTKEMLDHGVPPYYIESCCKIQYLFPRAHAVAYCMMGVRVGWFKVHEPLAFYAGYFTTRCSQFDLKTMCSGVEAILQKLKWFDKESETRKLKPTEEDLKLVLQMSVELYERGFKISNPSINDSDASTFKMDKKHNCIIPPFSALTGVGASMAESIVAARKDGPFSSVEDLLTRSKVSAQKVEELRELGALEGLPETDQMTLFDM